MERLVLEPFRPDHAPALFAGLSDPALYCYLPDPPPPDLASVRDRIDRIASGRSPDGTALWFNWMIRTATGDYAGTVQATIDHADHPPATALLGYIVFTRYWRRGIARASVGQMLDWLFATGHCDSATALVDTRNAASIGLLTGLGFTPLILHQDADFFAGETSHEIEFGLERAQWQGGRPGLASRIHLSG